MTAPAFILIVSIIVRFGEGGLTEAQPFTTLEACLQRQVNLDVQLKGKVAALDSRCEEEPPTPAFKPPPAVKPPPAIVKPMVKPAKAVRQRTAKQAAPSAWSKNCLYRKYRLANGARRWYCKRWK